MRINRERMKTIEFFLLVVSTAFLVEIGEALGIDIRIPAIIVIIGISVFVIRFSPQIFDKLRSVFGEEKRPPGGAQ